MNACSTEKGNKEGKEGRKHLNKENASFIFFIYNSSSHIICYLVSILVQLIKYEKIGLIILYHPLVIMVELT